MDYYEARKLIKNVIPRRTQLILGMTGEKGMKEKGRKSNYHQWDLTKKEMVKNERLLNENEINSFAEISLRASGCPMPLNIDVWDGLFCPFKCQYCFADSFRASLYTAFFDNSKTMGLRHCNVDYYKRELDKLLKGWKSRPFGSDVQRAICKGIPLRFGIRFEDFIPIEGKREISLNMLQYLANASYPVMINTKSDLVGDDRYVKALADNKGKAAVHVTLITSDEDMLKRIEPGAPSYKRRLKAMKVLSDAGIRVVARIEPFMVLINDDPDCVKQYMEEVWETGCRNITFDTYSYSANAPGIRRNFYRLNIDYQRMFALSCDSQGLGSFMLGKFMNLFRDYGFSCSTFDMGNVPENDDPVCCEVGNWFTESTFNEGSSVSAVRYIMSQDGPVTWDQYRAHVIKTGGFLSESLEREAHELWNVEGNAAYSLAWAKGITAVGYDKNLIWTYNKDKDFRTDIFNFISKGEK